MPQNPRQVTCSNLFTPGRACAATAVVLHEWSSGIENLDHEMCRCLRPRPLTSPGCHTSFHFGIGGNCNFRQYVPLADTAWGFYFVPSPLCPIPPCPINQLCDGIGSDQYNPQENGTLPTPVVSAGPDLSANCSVIHVAIATGAARTGSGLFCIGSPNFSENSYRCLVESLCYIYETAGLVPNGYSSLLTHIGELMELDLDQLAIDIQACMDFVPAPPPPCDCATPVSPAIDNMILSQVGGLYSNFTVTDTGTVDLVKTGNALSANVKISPNAGNIVTAVANGLFVPAPSAPVQTPITPTDTNSVNLTVSGTNGHTLQADVIISPTAGNTISVTSEGLLVLSTVPPAVPCDPYGPAPDYNAPTQSIRDNSMALGQNNLGEATWQHTKTRVIGRNTSGPILPGNDVYYFGDTGAALTVSLWNPLNVTLCDQNELWIKNNSNFPLTVTLAAGNFDYNDNTLILPGKTGATGNTGGASVHLICKPGIASWLVIASHNM